MSNKSTQNVYISDKQLEKIPVFGARSPRHNVSKSTKQRSLAKVNASVNHIRIVNLLRTQPNLTRSEIAEQLSLRLSSVCGRVRELILDGTVCTSGEKYDLDTKRYVQTLELKDNK
jgi:predicted transcriptional regulator